MYIYLDESGSLTKSSEKYFVVCSYTVGEPRRVAKAFRRWQKTKFPKKIKGQSEVKFNDPHIDDKLRVKTIKFLAKQDVRIFYTYLKKKNIPEEYHREDAVDSSSSPNVQIADWVCGALAQYHEKKYLGEELYVELKRNIVQGKELFSDYWTKRWEK